MAGDAAVLEVSIIMMVHRFAAEHCANALVPVLEFDAAMLAVPLK
jgi:hypothetical protein